MKLVLILILVAVSLNAETTVRYWSGGHEKADLAQWAMEAWARASDGLMRVARVDRPEDAEIRFRWVNPRRPGLYGQSLTTVRDGKPISEVVINPSLESLGGDMLARSLQDRLFGDVILFLTCVHEAGHALGPVHTREYEDIMYSFEFGGDFAAYFDRYRKKLQSMDDMKKQSPFSANDLRQIKEAAARRTQNEKR